MRTLCMMLFLTAVISFTGCTGDISGNDRSLITEKSPEKPPIILPTFEDLDISETYDIRQFEGMTLNFIVENNLYANILSHENEEFSKVTGINIKIRAMDFDTLAKKINLDFISKAGKYQILYVDPYQTLNRFYKDLEVLNPYIESPEGLRIKGFPEDFFENQTEVSSYFKNKDTVYTIPFDSTTMILYYRKDIFDKYRDRFYAEKHYDWTPGSPDFTWERYCEVARWIDANVPDEEIRHGSGQMAQEHNSVFCEFSNILAAYGGDYFSDSQINTLGADNFNTLEVLSPDFVQALEMYKKVVASSAPGSVNWNWTDTAEAFRSGEIAMMLNWDENYAYMEHDLQSPIRGRVGYAILPAGDARSASIYGGSGIGINKYATAEEKQAAWLYIVWATSKEMQLKVLEHPEGGSLPTRKSAYEDPVVKRQIENPDSVAAGGTYLKHIGPVLSAWKEENLYLRPKVSHFYEAEQILIRNLHAMIESDLAPKAVSKRIFEQLSAARLRQ